MEKEANEIIKTPDFKVDKIPSVRIKSIAFKNYKVFEDYKFDFADENDVPKEFLCFIGPMGSGKSTILYTIQMLFSTFDGYEKARLINNLSKNIRHIEADNKTNKNFNIVAEILVDNKPYTITLDKNGFKKKHPKAIRELLYRICYLSKLDQDLNKFQLKKEKWASFKELFESVTGYVIEEYNNPFFETSDDPRMALLMEEYVLDFLVKKPNETIHHKDCSDGEKKIIKSFSTMLNLEYTPSIILIDNFEMHVHRFRHIILLESLRKCYPNSQIFATTHSHYASKMLGEKTGIYDMRVIKSNSLVKKDSWRLKAIDELDDCIIKLKTIKVTGNDADVIKDAEKIKDLCYSNINDLQKFEKDLTRVLNKTIELFVRSICIENR